MDFFALDSGRSLVQHDGNDTPKAWHDRAELRKAMSDYNQSPSVALMYFNRGLEWHKKGELDKAISDFKQANRLDPKDAVTYNAIAWIQATCPDALYRDGRTAVGNAMKACELNEWKHYNDLDTLAAAYAESGDFDEAQKSQAKAIDLSPDDEKADIRSRLELYKARKRYREDPPHE